MPPKTTPSSPVATSTTDMALEQLALSGACFMLAFIVALAGFMGAMANEPKDKGWASVYACLMITSVVLIICL